MEKLIEGTVKIAKYDGSFVEMQYEDLCHLLGFKPDIHFVYANSKTGKVGHYVTKPDEYYMLLSSLRRNEIKYDGKSNLEKDFFISHVFLQTLDGGKKLIDTDFLFNICGCYYCLKDGKDGAKVVTSHPYWDVEEKERCKKEITEAGFAFE